MGKTCPKQRYRARSFSLEKGRGELKEEWLVRKKCEKSQKPLILWVHNLGVEENEGASQKESSGFTWWAWFEGIRRSKGEREGGEEESHPFRKSTEWNIGWERFFNTTFHYCFSDFGWCVIWGVSGVDCALALWRSTCHKMSGPNYCLLLWDSIHVWNVSKGMNCWSSSRAATN